MSLPRHHDCLREVYYATLLTEVRQNPTEIVEQEAKAELLLAQHLHHLVKLELVEYFLIRKNSVFVEGDTVRKDSDIDALHVSSVVLHRWWLRSRWQECLFVVFVDLLLVPCVLSKEGLVQSVLYYR